MMNPQGIDSITLSVRNLEASMSWYRERFGLEELHDDSPNSPGVIIGNDHVQICLQQIADPAAPTVDHPRTVCVRLFAFRLTWEELERTAAEFPEDPDIIVLDDHPRYQSRIIEDPDGHCIELCAPRG